MGISLLLYAFLALVVWGALRQVQLWIRSKEFPGPKPSFIIGNLLQLQHLLKSFESIRDIFFTHEMVSQVFPFGIFGDRTFMVSDPEVMTRVLKDNPNKVSSGAYKVASIPLGEGIFSIRTTEKWRPFRKALSHAFSLSHMRNTLPIIEAQADTLLRLCMEASKEDTVLDMDALATRLTFDVISEVALGQNFHSLENPDKCPLFVAFCKTLRPMANMLKLRATRRLVMLARQLGYRTELDRTSDHLQAMVMAIVKKGRKDTEENIMPPKGSIFSLLLSAKDESGALLPDECVRDNLITFLFAGHDTTAHTMSFFIYEMQRNPEVLKTLQEELDATLKEGEPITHQVLNKLQFLDQCLKESLRLHPAGFGSVRCLNSPVEWNGRQIPAGAHVALLNIGVHYDERYYPNPMQFNPDNFLPEREKARPVNTWMPFSAGPRDCIGKTLALIEAKCVLAKLFSQFEFPLEDKEVKHEMGLTLKPMPGVFVRPRRRGDQEWELVH